MRGSRSDSRTWDLRLARAEVQRLAGMPSMRCFGPKGADPYILPPILYPDGHVWLKLGGDPVDIPLESEGDIQDWFRSGGSIAVADGLEPLRSAATARARSVRTN